MKKKPRRDWSPKMESRLSYAHRSLEEANQIMAKQQIEITRLQRELAARDFLIQQMKERQASFAAG